MQRVDHENTQKIYNDLIRTGLDIEVGYYGNTAVVRIDKQDVFQTTSSSGLNTFISGVYTGYFYGRGDG